MIDTTKETHVAQDTLGEPLRNNYRPYGDTERGSPERDTYLYGLSLVTSLNIADTLASLLLVACPTIKIPSEFFSRVQTPSLRPLQPPLYFKNRH